MVWVTFLFATLGASPQCLGGDQTACYEECIFGIPSSCLLMSENFNSGEVDGNPYVMVCEPVPQKKATTAIATTVSNLQGYVAPVLFRTRCRAELAMDRQPIKPRKTKPKSAKHPAPKNTQKAAPATGKGRKRRRATMVQEQKELERQRQEREIHRRYLENLNRDKRIFEGYGYE